MKTLSLLSLLLSTIYVVAQKPAKVSVEVSIANDSLTKNIYYACDSATKSISLKITIKNNTKKPLGFWLMNCSPSLSFVTDTTAVEPCSEACFRNFPTVIELDKKGEYDLFINCSVKDQLVKFFKLGFIYVDVAEAEFGGLREVTDTKKEKHEIIWSNSIAIP